ncbi:glycosyltransferase [Halomonas sp. BM-2019]|uniref:glycosyltransferase family 32 protein n=1 Tax=Halomonas sp. BM-2019 TaxID=2811227 RepID=UPI001B3C27CD|nr:MAG: glycosyl transferase [Halomonas sp. BM-2019]
MKPLHRLLTSRLIKLVANLLKLACYPFHFAFPDKRFTLPSKASPWIRSRQPTAIPRILWQTNFTDRVTLPVYLNYLFNRLMAPGFEYRFMITEARADFIRQHYSKHTFGNYSRLQIGAAQADFWRVLVLQAHGGVYLDIDAHLTWPLGRLLGADRSALFIRTKRGTLNNFFIASRPHTSELGAVIRAINTNIEENTIKGVFDMTGPGVFNRVLDSHCLDTVLYRYACTQGSFTNEHFQYLDKPQGKWHREQQHVAVVREEAA